MANFNDLYKKFVIYGECYYNLDTHELKLNFKGKEEEGYYEIYASPKTEEGFINMISKFITKYEEKLYKDTDTWIKLQEDGSQVKITLANESNK